MIMILKSMQLISQVPTRSKNAEGSWDYINIETGDFSDLLWTISGRKCTSDREAEIHFPMQMRQKTD